MDVKAKAFAKKKLSSARKTTTKIEEIANISELVEWVMMGNDEDEVG